MGEYRRGVDQKGSMPFVQKKKAVGLFLKPSHKKCRYVEGEEWEQWDTWRRGRKRWGMVCREKNK